MKLEPHKPKATTIEVPPGPSVDVEKGHASVEFTCDCGWEGNTSVPKRYTGRVNIECPDCGTVHRMQVVKER